MSVIGFDLGNLFSYTACARAGGIETLANEYSARHTPTFVSFSGKQRFMGTASHQAVVTNLKNTFYNLKRFVGKSFDDPAVLAEREKFGPAGKMLRGEDGSILFETRYIDEVKTFTPEQLLAAMLTKLKENAEMALDGKKVSDCVISVPSYYTEQQRRKLLEASQMANLNSLKLMNETTAVALSYGIYKQDLPAPEEPPRYVIFVDFGQSSLQTSAVALHKGKLKMLASMSDADIGGRDFDLRLAEKFAEDFAKKSKIDVRKNPRSFLRLVAECEKMKKTMSANATDIPINIECLVDEIDFSAKMKRDDFEVLCEDLIKKIEDVFVRLLADCGLTADQIHSVEVIGGGSRIPAVKSLVGSIFGKEPSTTLNADEAVARGCALQCAILSPTFRVRDFSVEDCQNFPIDLVFQNADGTGEQRMEVFPRSSNVPSSKVLTFYRKEAFRLKAVYGVPVEETSKVLPLGHSTIGEYLVQDVVPTEDGEPSKVKVKVRVDLCGLFKLTQAQLIVRKEEEEAKPAENEETKMNDEAMEAAAVPDAATVPDAVADAAAAPSTEPEAPMDAESTSSEAPNTDADSNALPMESTPSETTPMDQSAPTADQEQQQQPEEAQPEAPPEAPKKKAKIQTLSLTTQSMDSSMEKSVLTHFHELENEMISQDRQERDRQVAKNTLEEYVIEMRRKCGEELERFIEEKQREDFVRTLDGVEDWLYEEGEEVQKSIYVAKQLELEKIGNPIVDRYRQCQARPKAFDDLELTVQRANAFVEQWSVASVSAEAENGPAYEAIAHISKEDVGKMVDAVAKAVKWKTEKLEKQAKKSLTEAPAVTTSAIEDERKKLEKVVDSVINKPKPKKKAEKKDEKKDEEKENVNGKKEGEEEKMEEQMEGEKEGEKENVNGQKGGKDGASEVIKEPKIDEKNTENGVTDPTNEMDLD